MRRQLKQLIENQDRKSLPKSANAKDGNTQSGNSKNAKKNRSRRPPATLESWKEWVSNSQAILAQRNDSIPSFEIDPALPIATQSEEIESIIRDNQTVVICGETGSGKSTQLPKILLKLGYGRAGMIGHTQPRRIAARSIGSRVASELKSSLGEKVGYKIRFADQTSDSTLIKLMTDGILLAETQTDRFLENYDAIIIDEAHERSLNIDLLLGYLKTILPRRRDLKLIITSATIDVNRFSEHFAIGEKPAPIINVEGRTFPVEIRYRPVDGTNDLNPTSDSAKPRSGRDNEEDVFEKIVEAIEELNEVDRGDVLIFLPTERDIRAATKRIRGAITSNPHLQSEVLPLYARLSNSDQNKIFNPGKARRIILATNVAESSLTVPRVKFVIDTGTARISRYAPKSKVQRLPIEPISKASANQRSGRCGRVSEGICIRLYSEEDFESREKFTTPEIRRTNLASVILQAKSLKLSELDQIPFLDPPRPESIKDGYKTLFEIGAVDDYRRLTPLGRKLCKMPVDPRVGRMVFQADEENCLGDVLIIAAALEIRDPRDRPPERREAADNAHQQFHDERSDFMSLLLIWDFYHQQKKNLSQSKLRKACQQNFLSYNRLREWQDIYRQLRRLAEESGMKVRKRSGDYDAIHRSLLSGLLSGVAMKSDNHQFQGAGGSYFYLWPGSNVFSAKPKWIVASELVETQKRYLRNVASIQPEWIEPLAAHLTKTSYSDPHWSEKNFSCMAYEKVLLLGLPIVAKRRINYAKIEPSIAREILIDKGLVERMLPAKLPFLKTNFQLVDQAQELASKTRRIDLVFDSYRVFQFYDERLPEDVVDGRSLTEKACQWDSDTLARLTMTMEDLLPDSDKPADDNFPNRLSVGSVQVPVRYRFEPGSEDDGVTITVPLEAVRQIDKNRLDWMVPGLVEEKILGLIKSLPKQLRRNLAPAPDSAKKAAGKITFGKGIFLNVVAGELTRLAGTLIQPVDFDLSRIPRHLSPIIEVVDEKGKEVTRNRELDEIFGDEMVADKTITRVEDDTWNRNELTTWDFGDLPGKIELKRGGVDVPAFPALVFEDESVNLRLFDNRPTAKYENRLGLAKLYAMNCKKAVKGQVNWLPDLDKVGIHASRLLSNRDFRKQVGELIVIRGLEQSDAIKTQSDYEMAVQKSGEVTALGAQEVGKLLPKLFQSLHNAELALGNLNANRFGGATSDIKQQIRNLTPTDFLIRTPWQWLYHYPRFFEAIVFRIEKLPSRPQQDADISKEISDYLEQYENQKSVTESQGLFDPELLKYRFMLEEYRVSMFAQPLGTSITISSKRLEKQWFKVLSG